MICCSANLRSLVCATPEPKVERVANQINRKLRPRYALHSSRARLILTRLDIFVDNVHMELSLWDTAGQEEFDRLRALSYEDTHVLMLCFSVDSPDSFENVGSKWIAEINENCPGVRVCLTALKCDLRKDDEMNDNPNTISFDQGLAKAKEIGAVKYLGMLRCGAPCVELADRFRMLCCPKPRHQGKLLRGG